jgi:hypothetical protein
MAMKLEVKLFSFQLVDQPVIVPLSKTLEQTAPLWAPYPGIRGDEDVVSSVHHVCHTGKEQYVIFS